MAFSKFMAPSAGRIIRIIAGLIPLAAGALDVCLFNVLFNQPLSGKTVRAS